ncbi:MAG: hypothetical protein GY854_12720 [Deltaproteobacteria bacterium]|nr:hypothetical protein [Deltaproteobacteria bacterium]
MRKTITKETGIVFAAIAVGACLAFLGLTNHLFWDDEANTAIFGRNLLEYGKLFAWDGRNLIGFRTGAELNDNLENTYMPPLQYYVAAAGIFIFGESTFGARVLFVVAGLASIFFLALLMRRLKGSHLAWKISPFVLAVSPAYLLYIRNCRYYALAALFFVAMLAAWSSELQTKRQKVESYTIALASAVLLPLSHYLIAAAALASLPLFFALKQFRTRRHVALLGAIYGISLIVGIWLITVVDPFGSPVSRIDPTPPLERFFTLWWWHLRDLGTFEFVPVTLIVVLVLPFVIPKLADQRPLAARGGLLAAILVLTCLITALLSPQPVPRAPVADMRHLVPLIALGAGITGIILVILLKLWRPLAPIVAALVLLTNIPHLGFLGKSSGFLPPKPVGCTLCDYVLEGITDYETSTEKLVSSLKKIPKDSVVLIYPPFMAYSPMFYLPELRFCCQLDADKEIHPSLEAELPDYLYWEKARVDIAFISSKPPPVREGPLDITYRDKNYKMGQFRVLEYMDIFRDDRSRPEIPWHSFSDKELKNAPHRGFFVADIAR